MERKTKLSLEIFFLLIVAITIILFYENSNLTEDIATNLESKPNIMLNFEGEGKKSVSDYIKNKYKSTTALNLLNKDKAYPGFTLYTISGPEEIKLLNMSGQTVHSWSGIDSDRTRLLKNCNIITLHGSKNRIQDEPWNSLRTRVSEYDWEGNLVWHYTSKYVLHHDVQRLDNGNTLILLKVPVPKDYLNKVTDQERKGIALKGDVILEINSKGKEVWRWNSWQHIDVNDCGVRKCLGRMNEDGTKKLSEEDSEDWTHLNTISVIPDNKWYKAGDKRFKPGNIIVMPRNFWTILIIDRDSGEIVWRYTGDYKGGLIGGHEPIMVPLGFPGESNILILDNGDPSRNNSSFILEINPTNKKLDWVYDVGDAFHTRARGSVQRFPNGNTLISEDRSGRVFEVTREKEKVWEYVGNLLTVRAQRYEPNYCPKLSEFNLY